MKKYYIDLGSSTIKVYAYEEKLELLEEHSIYFKNGFSKETGLSEETKAELLAYFEELMEKYHFTYERTNLFVTGIFRELSETHKEELIREFNQRFDLNFHMISHGIENYYLGKAMENDYNDKKVLIINMGGKTTELITFEGTKITKRSNLKIGVAELLNRFPEVNESHSGVSVEDMARFVEEQIAPESFDTDYDCAIFTGGEERFEKLTNYHLVENDLFQDGIHAYKVSLEDYIKGTKVVFEEYTLEDLHNLMKDNPKWMDGARAGAILPLAIFQKAQINWIVPSDLNLINGVINDIK